MYENSPVINIETEFENIVSAEESAALEQFEANLGHIDTSVDQEAEAGLATITMGKMVGCQDTGGGGHEWEKLV